MSLNDTLTQLIELPNPRALVLQGTWGRGKTHLWRTIWSEYVERCQKEEKKLTRYAYVSLFGINSLDELKQAIFESNEELLVWQESSAEKQVLPKRQKDSSLETHRKSKKRALYWPIIQIFQAEEFPVRLAMPIGYSAFPESETCLYA